MPLSRALLATRNSRLACCNCEYNIVEQVAEERTLYRLPERADLVSCIFESLLNLLVLLPSSTALRLQRYRSTIRSNGEKARIAPLLTLALSFVSALVAMSPGTDCAAISDSSSITIASQTESVNLAATSSPVAVGA